MNYIQLKKIINTNIEVRRKIYVCSFLTCRQEKIKNAKISLVKNLLGKYVVTLWIDYEYGKALKRITFKDKNLAADYAWQLFNDLL